MKAKITKGKNFKTIVNYIFSPGEKNKPDRFEWIGGTLGSNNPQEIIADFDTVQRLRPHIEKPSWQCSLTLPKGEYLSDGKWESVVEDFMEKMEFSKHTPYTIVRHNDTEFDHVHIVASRVPMTGPVWTGRNDVYKAIAATQELEEKYNLTRTPGYRKRGKARETYRERKKAERTGVTPPRIQLQELIDRAVADKPTAPQFAQRLEEAGVTVRANLASTGRMNGFSFELEGLAFKGSKLGKAYGWGGLQKRGVTYDAETDAAELERYRLPVEERSPHQRQTDEVLTSAPIKTVENEPDNATTDTDSTSPEPQTEKMLTALDEYYQSQINKNDETQESRPKEDLGNFSQPETAQKAYDLTNTDTTELSSVKEALETTLEEMEKITESMRVTIDRDNRDNYTQGESRTRVEEFSSLTALIEDTAQKEETEVVPEITTPEVTQPPVEPSVYSKALATETSPEATQPPTEPTALSETLQEQNQQQEWIESLVPDLAQLLIDARTHQLEGERRTLTWDKEQQRLNLRENETQEIVLDAKWKEGRWQDNGSNLTAAFFEQIKQALDTHNRERERELQKQRSSGGFELG